ncbi:MAG: hypothetical protein ABW042_02315, partial [Phenylobacterium sp.]
ATAHISAPIRALWKEAANFIVCVLLQVDRDKVRAGIDRTQGARLSIWLGGAEAALRRLIIIAALAFTPAPLKHPTRPPTPRTSPSPRPQAPRSRGFRVFHELATGRRGHTPPRAPRPPAPYRHLRFAIDPMLALGRGFITRPTPRHNGGPAMTRHRLPNPLDRWGRLSRNDPDWRPPEPQPRRAVPAPEPKPDLNDVDLETQPRTRRRKPRSAPRHDSTADWRRCYDEWNRRVPAPALAARLDALNRIIANPAAIIQRTARRLLSRGPHTLMYARDAYPVVAMPRRARHVVTSGHAQKLAADAQDKLDSS